MAVGEDDGNHDLETVSEGASSNDPWRNGHQSASEGETVGPAAFEDDFVDRTNTGATDPTLPRLPDSDEYLASLEAKLARVQSRGSLVRDLCQKREDEMRRLLGRDAENETSAVIDPWSEEPLRDNPLLRRLAPSTQALTREELVALLEADALQKKTEEQEGEQVKEDSLDESSEEVSK